MWDAGEDACSKCQAPMCYWQHRSLMICERCGESKLYLNAVSSAMPFGDETGYYNFSYRRINHFNEHLQHAQGKEKARVPDEIVEEVGAILRRQRIAPTEATCGDVRNALKALKHRKHYEHATQIRARLSGSAPLQLPPDVESQCKMMFMALQQAFDKFCPENRKNMLSYSYCLYKFLELLGYDNMLDTCQLLKGKDKLARQDAIFNSICSYLDWEFVPTI